MSTDFITIKEAKAAKKDSFIGVVVNQGDLKSGTKNDKDWTKKTFTIQDTTADVILTAWGDEEISRFKVGNKYEFVGCWWKEYEGKVTLAIGNYAVIKLIGTDDIGNNPKQTTMPENTETRGEINGEELPEYSNEQWVRKQALELLQIEEVVIQVMLIHKPKLSEINHQKLGMFVKEIYKAHMSTEV